MGKLLNDEQGGALRKTFSIDLFDSVVDAW